MKDMQKEMEQSNPLKKRIRKEPANGEQKNILVEFMEMNNNLARGTLSQGVNGKQKVKATWDSLTNKLNSAGPPAKTITEWKLVWKDMKYNVKRKLSHNKKVHNKTGGGAGNEIILSKQEESVIESAGLAGVVTGLQNVQTFGVSRENVNQNIDACLQELLEVTDDDDDSCKENKSKSPSCSSPHNLRQDSFDLSSAKKKFCRLPRVIDPTESTSLIREELNEQKKFYKELLEKLEEKNIIDKDKVKISKENLEEYKRFNSEVLNKLEEANLTAKEQLQMAREESFEAMKYRKRKIELRMVEVNTALGT